jgi:hypothetical protein
MKLLFALAILLLFSFGTKDQKAYDPTVPKWIKITKTYSDFAAASVTNSPTIYTLPAKGVIHATQLIVTTTFSGGAIATYTLSIGIAGTAAKYNPATNMFTGATLPSISTISGIESSSGSTSITCTAISTIGLLNAATQGSVDIYLLVSQLP